MQKKSFAGLARTWALIQSVVPFLFFILTLYLLFFSHFSEAFFPIQVTSLSETKKTFANKCEYVQLHNQTLHYTGYDYMVEDDIVGSYYYAFEEDICYFFLIKNSTSRECAATIIVSSLSCRLIQNNDVYHELTSHLAEDLSWSVEDVESIVPEFIISEYHYLSTDKIIAGILLIICVAVSGMASLCYLVVFLFPCLHFQQKPCCRYSALKTLIQECECQTDNPSTFRQDTIGISTDMFFSTSEHMPAIIPMEQVLWVYRHSTVHRFTLMPAKLTDTLHVMTKTGKHYYFKSFARESTSKILHYLEDNYPDIIIGYSQKKQTQVRVLLRKHKRNR